MSDTHAISWQDNDLGGWFTKCGAYTEVESLLSDDPSCPACQCWNGHHKWLTELIGGEQICAVCSGIKTARIDGLVSDTDQGDKQ